MCENILRAAASNPPMKRILRGCVVAVAAHGVGGCSDDVPGVRQTAPTSALVEQTSRAPVSSERPAPTASSAPVDVCTLSSVEFARTQRHTAPSQEELYRGLPAP